MTTRERSAVWLVMALLPLMMVGCQLGFGARPAATPIPPATPLPALPPSPSTPTPFEKTLQSTGMRSMEKEKVLDGNLHVRYLPPCEIVRSPALWVASIILTDLRSGSIVHLNRDGTLRENPKPYYKTEEGKATLESVLKDSSIMEQVVARPECPEGLSVADPAARRVARAIRRGDRRPTAS